MAIIINCYLIFVDFPRQLFSFFFFLPSLVTLHFSLEDTRHGEFNKATVFIVGENSEIMRSRILEDKRGEKEMNINGIRLSNIFWHYSLLTMLFTLD